MKLEHVAARVALERMWIYAREYTVSEREDMSHRVLCGHKVTYVATDDNDNRIGSTTIEPEDFPVTLVTEINF